MFRNNRRNVLFIFRIRFYLPQIFEYFRLPYIQLDCDVSEKMALANLYVNSVLMIHNVMTMLSISLFKLSHSMAQWHGLWSLTSGHLYSFTASVCIVTHALLNHEWNWISSRNRKWSSKTLTISYIIWLINKSQVKYLRMQNVYS